MINLSNLACKKIYLMKTISMFASMVVTLALLCYSIGFFKERKKRLITASVLSFYTVGVLFDICATIMMILGSSKGMLTIHGFYWIFIPLGDVDGYHFTVAL